MPRLGHDLHRWPVPALVALVLAMVAPALLVRPGAQPLQNWMESISMASAQETWLRQHSGERGAWLTPTVNGSVRSKKPPMFVWTTMLAWTGLDPLDASPQRLLARARLMSALLAMAMVLCVLWIGDTLGDRALGLIAALAAGMMPLLQSQARMASYDIHLAAWVTIAVAATAAMMKPGGRNPGARNPGARRALGSTIAMGALAVATLAAALLTKGPLALVIYAVPAGLFALHFSRSGIGPALKGLSVALLASIAWIWWYRHVNAASSGASGKISEEISAKFTNPGPIYFYPKTLLVLSFPWTLWLIGGLLSPLTERGEARLRHNLLLAWGWLVALVIAFSLVRGKAERYIVPAIPAAGLLVAACWRGAEAALALRRRSRGVTVLAAAQVVMLIVGSLAMVVLLAMPEALAARGWLKSSYVTPIPWPWAIIIGLALLTCALGCWWMIATRNLRAAAIATAIWASLSSLIYRTANAGAPAQRDVIIHDSSRVMEAIGEAPLSYLRIQDVDSPSPGNEFLFYTRRVVPSIKDRALDKLRDNGQLDYVMAMDHEEAEMLLGEAGFQRVLSFEDEPDQHRALWVEVDVR
jgi:4-amino-4-deoxy-L-arabinose transferase-like glycosyltransferase